jgi:hypothetical protein
MLHVVYVTSAVVPSRFPFVDDWNLSDFFGRPSMPSYSTTMFTCKFATRERSAKNLDSLRGYMDFQKEVGNVEEGEMQCILARINRCSRAFPAVLFPWVSTCGKCSNACWLVTIYYRPFDPRAILRSPAHRIGKSDPYAPPPPTLHIETL